MINGVRKQFLLIVLVSIIVMSCNSIKQEDEFSNLIQVQNVTNINQDLELRLDPYQPSDLRNGGEILLEILNKSEKFVRFPADRNIQIFLSENRSDKWVEVENNVEYQGNGDMIVPLGEKGFHETFILVIPILENDGKEKPIRIVISGIIVEKGADTNKALSAYLDLTIKP